VAEGSQSASQQSPTGDRPAGMSGNSCAGSRAGELVDRSSSSGSAIRCASRLMLASVTALLRVTGAVLQSAPTLIEVNHLFAAPFGPQLGQGFDEAAVLWPPPALADVHAPAGDAPMAGFGEIRIKRTTAPRRRDGDKPD
jgi:hypothetical protein